MQEWFQALLGNEIGLIVSIVLMIVLILAPLILTVAYLTYFERKVIGYMQLRVGPNVTGPFGLIQPFADVLKLLFKEVTRPSTSNKALFYIGPMLSLAPAFAAWAVIPFSETWVLTNVNAGLLYILMITSLSVYGVIIAGWASNSKYAFLGAMRSSAQTISYEIAMGAALVGVVMVSGSMNFGDIVAAQSTGIAGGSGFSWNLLPLFPLFLVYLISAVAETNRAPFDVAEGESEIVAGFHVEYSGFAFALFFLAEYIFMILIAALTALMFLGGWLSPFPQSWGLIGTPGAVWMFIKMAMVLYGYLWIRATFPRYRYDQIMRLGWKVLIPVGFAGIVLLGLSRTPGSVSTIFKTTKFGGFTVNGTPLNNIMVHFSFESSFNHFAASPIAVLSAAICSNDTGSMKFHISPSLYKYSISTSTMSAASKESPDLNVFSKTLPERKLRSFTRLNA